MAATLTTITTAAKRAALTMMRQSGESPDGVDALLAMHDGLSAKADQMIRDGWPRSAVRQSIADGIAEAREGATPTAKLVFRRSFMGESKATVTKRTRLAPGALIDAIDAECTSEGWGCVVELSPEQLATAGGYIAAGTGAGVLTRAGGHQDDRVVIVRPAHRPRRDPTAARVVRSYRLHPTTIAALDAESKRTGESAGQVIDRLAQGLAH